VAIDPACVRRVIVTSGKLYYDLASERERGKHCDVPILRAEQLYPFPVEALTESLSRYRRLKDVVWAQEEPKNHGAWYLVRDRLESALPAGAVLSYEGRPAMAPAANSEGAAHANEQRAIARSALALGPG